MWEGRWVGSVIPSRVRVGGSSTSKGVLAAAAAAMESKDRFSHQPAPRFTPTAI